VTITVIRLASDRSVTDYSGHDGPAWTTSSGLAEVGSREYLLDFADGRFRWACRRVGLQNVGWLGVASPVTAADTADELRTIARSATDALGYFPALYSQVTERVAAGIAAGDFDDGPRMDEFVGDFARRYISAFRDPAMRARCWQACWDVAGKQGLLIIQHLLLGINAHVNYDLAQTVADIGRSSGDFAAVRRDFDAVNVILAATSVDVLRSLDVVSRWTNELAALGGGKLFNFSLRAARAQAWRAGVYLAGLDAAGQARYLSELDELVAVLAYLVTRPGFPVSLLVPLARRLETRRPATVTAALLGQPRS
jgi:hypothetical protein